MRDASPAASCPDDAAFCRLVTGAIEPDARARLLAHADDCDACHELLARVLRDHAPPSEQETLHDRERRADDLPRPGPGTVIDHYVIVDRLGAGAMGEVLRARDTVLGREVALKLLQHTPGPQWEERLVREARAMARLSHPNVVAVYGVGEWRPEASPPRVYVAMELVVGTTLRRWCEAQRRTWPELMSAWIDAGLGLAAAHAQGIVHRDFKPDNVLVGDDGRVRVGDFGLAASSGTRSALASSDEPLSDSLTRTGELMGTPRYMAPEQLRASAVTARADQFAFAVSLYHALFGSFPYAGKSLQELTHSYEGPPVPPARGGGVPPAIWDALRRALQADPDDRFADMDELIACLRRVLARRRRRRSVLVTAAVGIVGIGGGIAVAEALRERPCEGVGAPIDGAWDDARRATLAAALDDDAFARIGPPLDAFAQAWRDTAVEVCRATHVQAIQSAQLLELRMACLEDRRGRAHALVTALLADPDAESIRRAVPAIDRLPAPAGCRVAEGAGDPAAGEDAAVQDDLQRLLAMLELGRYPDARVLGEDVIARAVTPWGRARARLVLFGAYDDLGEPALASEALAAGLHDAAETDDDALIARYWMARIADAADHQRYELAAEQLVAARVSARRATDGPRLRFEIALSASRVHGVQGDHKAALREAERAVAAADEIGSQLSRASALEMRAGALTRLARHQDAIADTEGAVQARITALGETHPDTTRARQNLASSLFAANRAADARAQLHIAAEAARTELGDDSQLHGNILAALAVADAQLGAFAETIAEGTRAIEILDRLGEGETESMIFVRVALSHAYSESGRLEEAERASSEAVAIQERLHGPEHPALAIALIGRGELLRRMGEHGRALADYERVLRIVPARSQDAAYAASGAGFSRLALGERAAARELLERAIELHRAFGSPPTDVAAAERALAEAG